AAGLIQQHRAHGHLAARLDPLRDDAPAAPMLDPAAFGFAPDDLDRPISAEPFRGETRGTLRDLLAALRATYCDTVGVEYAGLDEERREWLEQHMEPARNHPPLEPAERLHILRRLLAADGFEEFLQLRYPGQKRFSLEGTAALVPMLDAVIESAGDAGVESLVIGMPHRGRLNVLANIMKKPLEAIFSEFESNFLPE